MSPLPACIAAMQNVWRHATRCDLPPGRRARRYRPGQVHGLHGLHRRLPLRGDLFQQGHEPGAEMHGLRPPSGQGLERAALRRCLSHRGDPIRRGRGVEEPYRGVGRAASRRKEPSLSSITGTCPNASLPARSSTPRRTSAWRTSKLTLTSVAAAAPRQTAGGDYCFRGDHGGQPKTGVTLAATTDAFGDFWFNQIDTAQYVLKIEKEGYVTRTIEAIDVSEKDVNLGDIELQKAP